MHNNTRDKIKRLAVTSVLTALGVVLAAVIHFPIFGAVPFLEYDPADIAVLLCTFMFGPLYGIGATVAVSVIQGLTVSAASGIYGIIMHIIATSSYVCAAGLIYGKWRTLKGAVVALAAGTAAMAAVMIPANLLITPLFTGMPVSNVADLLGFIVLFNLIKAGLNGVVTFFIYKPLKHLFKI